VIAVFADTSYWVALTNSNDTRHHDAVAFDKVTNATIYTTDEVLVELMTFLSADPWQRGRAAVTVRRLLINPDIRVFRKAGSLLLPTLISFSPGPTRATA
jgi:predicted nucleic acid-binding protein